MTWPKLNQPKNTCGIDIWKLGEKTDFFCLEGSGRISAAIFSAMRWRYLQMKPDRDQETHTQRKRESEWVLVISPSSSGPRSPGAHSSPSVFRATLTLLPTCMSQWILLFIRVKFGFRHLHHPLSLSYTPEATMDVLHTFPNGPLKWSRISPGLPYRRENNTQKCDVHRRARTSLCGNYSPVSL